VSNPTLTRFCNLNLYLSLCCLQLRTLSVNSRLPIFMISKGSDSDSLLHWFTLRQSVSASNLTYLHAPYHSCLVRSGHRVKDLRSGQVTTAIRLQYDYDTTIPRRIRLYDGSDRNYDLRSTRLRYDYDMTMTNKKA